MGRLPGTQPGTQPTCLLVFICPIPKDLEISYNKGGVWGYKTIRILKKEEAYMLTVKANTLPWLIIQSITKLPICLGKIENKATYKMHSLFFDSTNYLSSAYSVIDTVLGTGDTTVNKSDKNLCSYRAYILIGEHRWGNNKQLNT